MYTEAEIKAAGLDDFRVFLRQVWDVLQLPVPTPVQNDIAKALQYGPKLLIIEAFRGVGKSWETVAFVMWNLLLNPQLKILVVSANKETAADFTKFCMQLIHAMPILHHLEPREGQRKSSISFDVGPTLPDKAPSVKSVGITGQITGTRADIIVGDDIEVPKNSYTHLLREKLSHAVKEFQAVLKPHDKARIIYLGTPQIEASLYNRLVNERGYTAMIWPAEIPENPAKYKGRLAPLIQDRIDRGWPAGSPTEPRRFNKERLAEIELEYGKSGYALQMMLDTSPTDEDLHPLKLRNMIVTALDRAMSYVSMVWGATKPYNDLQPGGLEGDLYYAPVWVSDEMLKYQGTVMAIDPSGRGKDETGYAIVRFLASQCFLVESGGFLDGFADATLNKLAERAVAQGVTTVIIEENYGGGMFTALFKPRLTEAATKANTALEENGVKYFAPRVNPEEWDGWSRGQKEHRICDTLQPLLEAHRLIVDRSVIEEDLKQQDRDPQYSLIQQLTRITREKGSLPHEDRLEALSMACGYWTEQMDRDRGKIIAKVKSDQREKSYRQFLNGVFSDRRKEPMKWAGRRS
jgi:hypothetical protein